MQYSWKAGLWVVALLMFFASCSPFQKLQKTGTDEQKYQAAVAYFKKGEFYKAGLLFEELIPILKGSTESEMAQFYRAHCEYQQQNYQLSAFHFKQFYETFARSDYAHEAMYFYALSLYKDSPNYNLDQSNTLTAMAALQDFINANPQSPFRQECTQYITDLRNKLELKAYDKAKLYYKTSAANIANYRSSVVSITNFLREYPDSKFNQELAYLRVDAQYNLAKNSFADKLKERHQEVVTYYLALVDKFPQSPDIKKAERMYEDSRKELEKIAEQEKEKQNQQQKPAKVTATAAN
ncbi:Beta-barrel assembly machine subunit BamD [Larkinella arboricola]|uniref:Beta-barrel assembly machine subunit BamD n=1 Tax=Larkinella arboricola TaxID=643671 RepID=A0A327X869_LARAB|nr:outer membrane protein assembly factor BamD [Larkinella arboricola]RAJ99816.1 Beta-barrel assembly machine subunit BamD [Larkinella arboricola]